MALTMKQLNAKITKIEFDHIEENNNHYKCYENMLENMLELEKRIEELENAQISNKVTKHVKSLGRFIPKIRLENTPKIKVNF